MSLETQNQTSEPFYDKSDLGDSRRPIRTLNSFRAGIPAGSEKYHVDHDIDRVTRPDGSEGWHHRIKVPEGVMLAHIVDDPRYNSPLIGLVNNYRHAIGRWGFELPSGGLEPHEMEAFKSKSPLIREAVLKTAAIREFEEEMGVKLSPEEVENLFPGPLQGGVGIADITYNIMHALGGVKTKQRLDAEERGTLRAEYHSLDEALSMAGERQVEVATTAALGRLALIYGVRVTSSLKIPERFSHNNPHIYDDDHALFLPKRFREEKNDYTPKHLTA